MDWEAGGRRRERMTCLLRSEGERGTRGRERGWSVMERERK